MEHLFKFICCGNVDDGKSSLIGRLLLNTDNVKQDQLEDALRASHKNGSDKMEPAMLLDGLLDEREQQITIDVAHRYFDYKDIRFHILDCPGHEQYTKNMAIAAAEADTAVIVIDTTKGIKPQTLKHIEILSLFRLKNICVCLTKIDLLPPQEKNDILITLKKEIIQKLSSYDFTYQIIPVSAITGENTEKVLDFLYQSATEQKPSQNNKYIFHVLTSKLFQNKRFYYTKSSKKNPLTPETALTVYPQKNIVTVSTVYENSTFNIYEDIDISKGDCLTNCPVFVTNKIKHKTFWFEAPTPSMLFKHGTRVLKVVSLTPDLIELNDVLIFNNIETEKTNGFGIFIDEETKKTIGCAVFENNKKENINLQNHKIYVFTGSILDRQRKIKPFMQQFSPPAVLLEYDLLKDSVFKDQSVETIKKSILNLAQYLLTNQHNVILSIEKFDYTLTNENIIINQEK